MLDPYVKPLSSGSVMPWLTADRIVTTNSLSQLATPSSISTPQSLTLSGTATLTVAGLLTAQSGLTVSSNALVSGTATVTGLLTASSALTVASTVTLTIPLASTSGGTGVNNAGTLTNASNTTITGGGTVALGGFTLTVPATGTAGLLGVANNWSLANTFSLATGTSIIVSSTTDSTTKDTGSIVTEGGLGVEKAIFAGTNITAAAVIRSTAASGAAQLRVDSVDAAISRPSNAFYCMGGGGFDQGISLGPSGGVSIYQVANAAWRCTTTGSTDNLYVDFARWTWRDPSDGFNEKMTLFNGLLTLPVTTGVTLTVSSTNIAAITCAGGIKTGSTTLHSTSAALANGAAAQAGTLLNAPAAGNPTKWVPIDDNGTTRYIPCW